jgi:hypothetical protein
MTSIKRLALALAMGGVCNIAAAALPGYYLGTTFGYARNNHANLYAQDVFAGYQFNNIWGVEAQALSTFNHNNYQLVDAMAKATWDFDAGIGAYFKAGLGYYYPKSTTESQIAPVYGMGISYDITPHVMSAIDWTEVRKIGSMATDIDYIGLRVGYRFF